jgi:hypothetical protein
VPEVFEESSPVSISDECERRIETVAIHGVLCDDS